jgi:hypothetical protein
MLEDQLIDVLLDDLREIARGGGPAAPWAEDERERMREAVRAWLVAITAHLP